ncbi:putative sugar transporter, MFS superfamily [Pseudomonas syringae pv. lapsa]|nr:putative sugar transporter, MFS superfamily [Pseudomonas syringae pv. lapsa]
MSIYNKLDLTGWKPEQLTPEQVRFATWIAFFAWVFAVYDFILFGTLLPEIGRHFSCSEVEQAEIATWVAVGTAVVALAIGPLVDRLGRRVGIIFTVSGSAICSALTAIGGAWGKSPLILIRSLGGLGYAEETVNATYLSEIYAASDDPRLTKRRGFIYSLVQGGWPVGALIAAGLTAVLLPVIGWQGCFVFAAIPAIVIAILARKLKESPQFQIHQRITQLRKKGDLS